MKKRRILIYIGLLIVLFTTWLVSYKHTQNNRIPIETAKIAVRHVGHQLLLTNNDSTSLVLPIMSNSDSDYELSFENPISFEPSQLVSITQESFEKAKISTPYIVEVLDCSSGEVVHSYKRHLEESQTIIPCGQRRLPNDCYRVQFHFMTAEKASLTPTLLLMAWLLCAVIFLVEWFRNRPKEKGVFVNADQPFAQLGSFHFYPEQHKLIKEAEEISLSKKECELLELFVASPNQILKRDELTKRVWEDNGVFVGRSLDTYISKLRKKLQSDDTIRITNVHGVGYKLETTT